MELPDGSLATVTHVGQIIFTTSLVLDNVFCVPYFQLKLISIIKLTYHSLCITIFLNHFCVIQDLSLEKMIVDGNWKEGLHYLDQTKNGSCNSVHLPSPYILHQRLGYPSNKMTSLFFVPNNNKPCDANKCLVCPLTKHIWLRFPLSAISNKSPLELLHGDNWGGYPVASLSRARYFVTIIDDFTLCTWAYLMSSKSDTRDLLVKFINMVEAQFSSKVKIMSNHNGPEFKIEFFTLPRELFIKVVVWIHHNKMLRLKESIVMCLMLCVNSFFRPNFLNSFEGMLFSQ